MERPLTGRTGIFGGTFDPVHVGHLILAEQAGEQLGLEQILWIPAATAPHVKIKESSHQNHRLEMVRLAIAGNSRFLADDREMRRGGHSYTVDTLSELHVDYPQAEWVLLMGSDSLSGFPTWRDPHRICELAEVVVIARGGHPPPDLSILERYLPTSQRDTIQKPSENRAVPRSLSNHLLQMPQLEISSTDIRNCVRNGKSIRYMLPAAVEAYIETHRLYRDSYDESK